MSPSRAGSGHSSAVRTAALVAVLAGWGCAAGGARAERTSAAGSRVITEAELATLSVSNAQDVLEHLRPLWLRSAGSRSRSARLTTEVAVVTNGQYFGDLNSLRLIPASTIREIRYMTGPEATNAFPSLASGRHIESAIIIAVGRGPGQTEEARR
jgi:hypothetical protein